MAQSGEQQNKTQYLHGVSTKVLKIVDEASDVKSFFLEKPLGFTYSAGQYVMVSFSDNRLCDGKQAIPLTLSSSPTEQQLRVTVKKAGTFTAELFNIRQGDTIMVKGPINSVFTLKDLKAEKIGFLCAGTGIAPFISILKYLNSSHAKSEVLMINGNRFEEDIIFRCELEELSKEPNIKIINTLSSSSETWPGERGRISKDMISKYAHDPSNYDWFVCGPIAMTNDMIEILLSLGVTPDKIKFSKWQIPGRSDKLSSS